jgi:hypothetical protein
MGRIGSFLAGFVAGAVVLGGTMHYTVVRADDGVHVVQKLTPELRQPFVDIRQFTIEDWQNQPRLAAALMRGKQGHLLSDQQLNGFRESIGRWVDQFDRLR